MPRAPKPPGTAVDPRNGQRVVVRGAPMARFALPKRSDGLPYDRRVAKMWAELWADKPLSAVLLPPDRELLIRWAQSVDDWIKAVESARRSPVAKGSMGQDVPSPWWSIADGHMRVVVECERQIGIGGLNRVKLSIAIVQEQRGLADLSAGFPGDVPGAAEDGDDPRED